MQADVAKKKKIKRRSWELRDNETKPDTENSTI